MVLVLVYTLDLQALAVQEETLVFVEEKLADAADGLAAVHQSAVLEDLRRECVQIRTGQAPELRERHRQGGGGGGIGLGEDPGGGGGRDGDGSPLRIPEDMLQDVLRFLQGVVADGGFHGDVGLLMARSQPAVYKNAEGSHMHGRCLLQPYMPINAGAFVEPALLERSVHADGDKVLAAVIQILRDVIHLSGIAAGLVPQPETVHPDVGTAENAVEAKGEVKAFVGLVYGKGLAVPAHTPFGILPAHGLVAVAVAGFTLVRKIHHPVVRKGDASPLLRPPGLVKLGAVRALVMDGGCLGEVVEILRSAAEVLPRIRSMAESKLPVPVKTDTFTRLGLDDGIQHSGKEQSGK